MSDLSEDLARDIDCWPSDEENEDDIRFSGIHDKSNADQVDKRQLIPAESFRSKRTLAKSGKSMKSNLTSVKAREKLAQKENPTLAMIFMATFCLLRALSYVCVDSLYERQPEMSPWHMFFMRSCMGIAIMTLHVNVKLKKETWDCVTLAASGPLAFKTSASVATNLIQFSITKFLPATIISIVSNLAPIIVVILAFMILKEQIRRFDVLMIILTLVGIFVIILGGDDSEESSKSEPSFPMWVCYLLLFFNPFLSASGTIAMRKMPKFGDATVGWYLQWATGIVALILILALGQGFTIYGKFDWQDWLYAFGTGFTSVYSETARFKALKLYKAAALQKLIPLQTMFQWVFDVTIFHIHYSPMQDTGLGYLVVIYAG